MKKGTCKFCGKEVEWKDGHRPRLYCDLRCYEKFRWPKRKVAYLNKCQTCGKNFYGRRNGIYCSLECLQKKNQDFKLLRQNGYPYRWDGTTGKAVYQHTEIAEKALGRKLKRNEVVHHINGDRADNRNCNLLICTTGYHLQLHAKMSYLYQREHFA